MVQPKRIQDGSIIFSIKPNLTINSLLIYVFYTNCEMKLFCQFCKSNQNNFNFKFPTRLKNQQKSSDCQFLARLKKTMDPSRILLALACSSPQYLCQMILVRYSAMCRSMLHSVGRSSANIIIVMILPHSSSFTSVQWQAQNSRSN